MLTCNNVSTPDYKHHSVHLELTEMLKPCYAHKWRIYYKLISRKDASNPIRGSLQSHHQVCIFLESLLSSSLFLCISTA